MEKFSNNQQMQRQLLLDNLFRIATRCFAFLVLALLVGILICVMIGGRRSLGEFG